MIFFASPDELIIRDYKFGLTGRFKQYFVQLMVKTLLT